MSADLMLRGLSVFRALSPSCPCDLVILKGAEMFRVEVRTGYVGLSGNVSCSMRDADRGKSDVLAIVLRSSHSIEYRPPLESLGLSGSLKPEE